MIGQRRKITYEITANSYWPVPDEFGKVNLPAGGDRMEKTIEFVQKTNRPMNEADNLLKDLMGSTPFHIWYWEWNK